MNRNLNLSNHFTLGEMTRSATAERKGIDNTPPDDLIPMLQRLCVEILEPVRARFARPFRPSSGYRSKDLNRAIGGAYSSQHCHGEAVDIEVPGVGNYQLADWIRDNLYFDQLILECYRSGVPRSGWVHVSLKPDSRLNRSDVLTYSNRRYTQGLVA
jgi:hypothetical protein